MIYVALITLGIVLGYIIAPRIIAEYDRMIVALKAEIAKLEARIAQLEADAKAKL